MNASPVLEKRVWGEAELQALPNDGFDYELVSGELAVSPKNNFQQGNICAELLARMYAFAATHRLGAVCDSSTGFWMSNGNCRAPDISFIAKARLLGTEQPLQKFFHGAPDLAVEVLSPDSSRREIRERLGDYFASGTVLAWVIDPKTETAEVHTVRGKRNVPRDGELSGENVLPGFCCPVRDLFACPWE